MAELCLLGHVYSCRRPFAHGPAHCRVMFVLFDLAHDLQNNATKVCSSEHFANHVDGVPLSIDQVTRHRFEIFRPVIVLAFPSRQTQ